MKTGHILNLILGTGLFFSVLPGGTMLFIDEPFWFKNIIFQTSAYLLFTTLVFGIICSLININEKNKPVQLLIIAASIGFVIIPDLYLNSVVFLGREEASIETWHLVSLFTAIYQILSAVMFGLIALSIHYAVSLSNRFKDNDPPPPEQQ